MFKQSVSRLCFQENRYAERKKMNQLNVYVENNIKAKAVPTIVPLAYGIINALNEKIALAKNIQIPSGTREEGIPIWKRYSLSVPEAAQYFGIGEKRLYQIIAEHQGDDFLLEIGSHTKIKRELFSRFLDRATCI